MYISILLLSDCILIFSRPTYICSMYISILLLSDCHLNKKLLKYNYIYTVPVLSYKIFKTTKVK